MHAEYRMVHGQQNPAVKHRACQAAPAHTAGKQTTESTGMLQFAAAGGMQRGCAVIRGYLHELVGDVHEALLPHVHQAAPCCCYQPTRPAPSKPCIARLPFCRLGTLLAPFPAACCTVQNCRLHPTESCTFSGAGRLRSTSAKQHHTVAYDLFCTLFWS